MRELAKISDLFEVKYGVNLELYKLDQCESDHPEAIRFVSRKKDSNGVSAYVKFNPEIAPNPAGTISVAGGGTYVMSAFLQPVPYYSGRDVYTLIPKNEISELELIYYCQCIFANRYKYNYGRQANKTLKDILLPYQIPHDFLEVDFAELSRIDRSPVEQLELALNKKSWRYFYLNELFDITGTKTTPLAKLERHGSGSYPYVTTQETNNGVEGFYDFYTEEGNVLTVDSAVLGYCAYQPVPFSASDHVEKLVPRFEMNRYSALFIVTIINQEQYRYNYGRKCSHGRMEEIKIELPAKNARPDFEFMEAYIKSLPYSGSI